MDSFGTSSATAVPPASEPDHGVVQAHIPQSVSRAVLSWLRVRKTAQGYVLDWFPFLSSGGWLAAPILAGYALLFLVALVQFPLVGPVSTVDEQLNYYQTARNFVQYGFMNSGFLHDLSTSSNPAHHPYIYSHMPPGPEILVALLLKLFGERWGLIRLIFAVILFIGIAYFLRFVRLVLTEHGLTGAGYALLFISPLTVLQMIDHPAYSPFPLLLFFPVMALQRYYATGRAVHYWLALTTVLVASVYAVTLNFILFCVAWILLWFLGLVRLEGRHVAAMMLVGAAGIVLHLLQGMWFLGPAVFFEELRITFSNRILGFPSAEEVMGFYRAHDIVLHGTHHFNPGRNLTSINNSLRFPGRLVFLLLGVVVVVWGLARVGRFDKTSRTLLVPVDNASAAFRTSVSLFAKLGAWAVLAIVIPGLLFPAYTGDYALPGLGEFLLAPLAVAVLAYAVRELLSEGRALWSLSAPAEICVRGIALFLVTAVFLGALIGLGTVQQTGVKNMAHSHLGANPIAVLAEIGPLLKGEVAMTNVYPTTVSFFTQEAAFGGCEMAAFAPDGGVDPSRCHTAWIKGYGRGERVKPTHAVLFRHLFTGFTRCLDDCLKMLEARLDEHHDKVLETKSFTIYALKEN
jgi:hypothetical protein